MLFLHQSIAAHTHQEWSIPFFAFLHYFRKYIMQITCKYLHIPVHLHIHGIIQSADQVAEAQDKYQELQVMFT